MIRLSQALPVRAHIEAAPFTQPGRVGAQKYVEEFCALRAQLRMKLTL
jgi:hypothetical protein